MASKKRPTRPKSRPPAGWFWSSVDRQFAHERKAFAAKSDAAYENHLLRAQAESDRRENERAYLHDSIKLLRRFAHGFEARDGYRLDEVVNLSGKKLAKVKKLAALIRQEQASPHVEKVARTKEQRAALESYTGQHDIPNRKRFIVFTEQPEKTTVKVVRRKPKKEPAPEPEPGKKRKKAKKSKRKPVPHVELEIAVPGGVAREEFFHISDYLGGEDPETFKDIKKALKRMLPEMPHGWYVLVTSNHGNIGVPNQRQNLLEMIEADYIHYDTVPGVTSKKDDRGLASVVVGFKLVSFTKDGADREYIERLTRRQQLAAARRNERKRAQRDRRARLTGRR